MGTESMNPTDIEVKAIVMDYNIFMNGVDQLDQPRSSHSIDRRERHVIMSIFTFLLHESIINVFPFYNTMDMDKEGERITLPELKRRIAEALVAP